MCDTTEAGRRQTQARRWAALRPGGKPKNDKSYTAELTSKDPYVLTTKLEERGDVLKTKTKRVGLPVLGVVAKLDATLDVCGPTIRQCYHLDVLRYRSAARMIPA